MFIKREKKCLKFSDRVNLNTFLLVKEDHDGLGLVLIRGKCKKSNTFLELLPVVNEDMQKFKMVVRKWAFWQNDVAIAIRNIHRTIIFF